MYIVGITVKISDYVVDNVPLGRSEGVSGSVQEHLVVLLKCASELLHRHQRARCLAEKVLAYDCTLLRHNSQNRLLVSTV